MWNVILLEWHTRDSDGKPGPRWCGTFPNQFDSEDEAKSMADAINKVTGVDWQKKNLGEIYALPNAK